jgi:hypothetical protein
MLFRLRYEWAGAFRDLEELVPDAVRDDQHTLAFRATIPFGLWGTINVLRIDLPYVIRTPSGEEGLNPASLLDLLIFDLGWGKLGVGPLAALLPRAAGEGVAFQLGAAVGLVSIVGDWAFGGLNQNAFGEATALTLLRPFVSYTPLEWLTFSTPDANFVFDWRELRWTNLPLGLQVNVVAPLERNPLVFQLSADYNFRDLAGTREWRITAGVVLTVIGGGTRPMG